MLEFIDESELEPLGLDDVSLEGELDFELSVLLFELSLLLDGWSLLVLGAALVLGAVDMLGLVLELLGVLVVSLLLGGVVAPCVRAAGVEVVELELSVVDCA